MVVYSRIAASAGLLLLTLTLGCHEVTEYTDSGEFGVVILSAWDLSMEGYVAGVDGARTLCSTGKLSFPVGCTSGQAYEVSLEGMEVLDVYQITAGAGAGLDCMTRSPSAYSAYMSGGGSKILEMELNGYTVIDEFSCGSSPVDICRSPAGNARIYILDSGNECIREIWSSSNSQGWTLGVAESPMAVAGALDQPEVLVTTHGDQGGVQLHNLDYGFSSEILSAEYGPFSAVAAVPRDSLCMVAAPEWQGQQGRIYLLRVGEADASLLDSKQLEGHPVEICGDPSQGPPYFYIACVDGEYTRIYAYSIISQQIELSAELEGYPWEMSTNLDDHLIVLTSL